MHKFSRLQKAALWGVVVGMVLGICGLWYLHNKLLPGSAFSQGPYAP